MIDAKFKINKSTIQKFAKAMTLFCLRERTLEDFHIGTAVESRTGDFSDVKVVTPYGEIPWNQVQRISETEMKHIMIEATDKIYTTLLRLWNTDAEFLNYTLQASERKTNNWDTPKYLEKWMLFEYIKKLEALEKAAK